MKSRSGLYQPEQASRPEIVVASDRQLLVSEGEHSHAALVAAGMIKPSERILVLGEGEHSYEALLVAEEIERKGGVAAVQCITRSPALLGFAMETKSTFSDSYGRDRKSTRLNYSH